VDATRLTTLLKMCDLDQHGFLSTFINMWVDMGDKSMDIALVLLKMTPEETEQIDNMLRLSHRCVSLAVLMKHMSEDESDPLNLDPDQSVLDEMRATYLDKLRKEQNNA
jgi:hypothetical protein